MISVLPNDVIDQSAAGEVLENPASAVKELVENSLDAGAREIRVEIEGGGLTRLRVEDDGCGMSAVDATVCLQRHATSKIRKTADLQTLHTMGFRGEALAAIASVSKLELRTSSGREAVTLTVQGGHITHKGPCARNRGTTVEVHELFYNTPARLKFQKAAAPCAAAVLKCVETLALAHPEVRFELLSNGKPTFRSHADTWKLRAEEILGPFAHELDVSADGLKLHGLLGRPEEGRLNRGGQTIFVNRRPILSPLVSRAVKEGFGTRMEDRLWPVCLLYLELPADAVDVNVHPQKREVRFRDEGRVFSFVRSAVQQALEKTQPSLAPLPWDFVSIPQSSTPSFVLQETSAQPVLFHTLVQPKTLLGDYLLLGNDPWTLVDLRGAAARVMFESMEKPGVVVQPLLCPFEWALGPADEPEALAERLKPLGIEARAIGKRAIAVDAIPSELDVSDLGVFLREYGSERKLAAVVTQTCRASRRKIGFEHACMLWDKLQQCADQTYDPLGKKIQVSVTAQQLQEFFR